MPQSECHLLLESHSTYSHHRQCRIQSLGQMAVESLDGLTLQKQGVLPRLAGQLIDDALHFLHLPAQSKRVSITNSEHFKALWLRVVHFYQ